jgi:hypothetical protein
MSKLSQQICVCTLFEGDYYKGVAALINSLERSGFTGRIWVGYRGPLPKSIIDRPASEMAHTIYPTPDITVIFVRLETDQHFAHYKPLWCLEVLNVLDQAAAGVYYFDPDIVVLASWQFFENWLSYGIAVCEDSHYPINATHPRALQWQEYARSLGMNMQRPPEANLNSGLVGVRRESISFFRDWSLLLSSISADSQVNGKIRSGTRAHLFHIPDQDTFTIATWVTVHAVSRIGVDAMSLGKGEWLTLHATEGVKPWRRRVLVDLLRRGIGPDRALRRYWEFAEGSMQAESGLRIRCHRLLISCAAFLGRFYHRM